MNTVSIFKGESEKAISFFNESVETYKKLRLDCKKLQMTKLEIIFKLKINTGNGICINKEKSILNMEEDELIKDFTQLHKELEQMK